MTTNREWLYALDVADLTDWFDAEHVDDDGVSRSNDGVAAEHETDNTCNKSGENVTDSRTQLVADIQAWLESNVGFSVWLTDVMEQAHGWLDRQAAITERECANTRVNFADRVEFVRRIDELKAGRRRQAETISRLSNENDEYERIVDRLTSERDALAADLKECMEQNDRLSDERERWRGTCGMMADAAHEIERILAEMEAK